MTFGLQNSERILINMITITNIYNSLNEIAPFCYMDKDDNSGLLVGNMDKPVSEIVLALDITKDVVEEANSRGADVIISHHPVIYHPLKKLSENNPACLAFRYGISCICSHSPLDIANGGINDIIFDMIKKPLRLKDSTEVLCPEHSDGSGYGKVCESESEFISDEFARILKNVFGCTYVRFTQSSRKVKKIAFCSGGAGYMLTDAIAKGADAYFTGDTKHDQLITAKNEDVTLVDCGHFHTENIVIPYLKKKLEQKLGKIEIIIADSGTDPACYIV